MRRTAIFALAFALLLCAACGQEGAEPTPMPSMEPSAAPEQTGPVVEIPDEPYSYLTNEYEWFTLGDAYAAAMEPYETWHEYKYDEGTTLLIAPKETLADVSFYTMDMDEEGVFIPGEVFCTLDELTTEEPMVLSIQFYGSMTTYGMSFTAADGTQHNLMITMGGRGADEACPYNASEY